MSPSRILIAAACVALAFFAGTLVEPGTHDRPKSPDGRAESPGDASSPTPMAASHPAPESITASSTPSSSPGTASEPSSLAKGTARIRLVGGRVELVANQRSQLLLIGELASIAGIPIETGRIRPRAISLALHGVAVEEAIWAVLDGIPYRIELGELPSSKGHRVRKLSLAVTSEGSPRAASSSWAPSTPPRSEAQARIQEKIREIQRAGDSADPEVQEMMRRIAAGETVVIRESTSENDDREPIRYGVSSGEEVLGDEVLGEETSTSRFREIADRKRSLFGIGDDPELLDPNELYALSPEEVSMLDTDGDGVWNAIRLATESDDPAVRIAAMDLLAGDGSHEAINAALDGLQDENSRVVVASMEALEDEGDRSIIPQVEDLLEHEDPAVRARAKELIESLE